MWSQSRMVKKCYNEQGAPEENVSGGDDEEHSHASHALPLHSSEISSQTPAAAKR